jgi:hypothetical protein
MTQQQDGKAIVAEGQEHTLLWSDVEVSEEAEQARYELDGSLYVRHVISQSLIKMRHDYEAALTAAAAERDELLQQLVMVASAAQDNATDVVSAGNLLEIVKAENKQLRAEVQRLKQAQWEQCGYVSYGEYELWCDEVEVAITKNGEEVAKFEWPESGAYAVCRLAAPQEGDE